jgi:hypothetical protein
MEIFQVRYIKCLKRAVNGWMNEWMDEWMSHEWMDEWIMDEWMNEWMNGWMNGWMNEWMNGENWSRLKGRCNLTKVINGAMGTHVSMVSTN